MSAQRLALLTGLSIAACRPAAPRVDGRAHVVHPVVKPVQLQDAPPMVAIPAPRCRTDANIVDGIARYELPGGVRLELVRIEAGRFWMGSPPSEAGRWEDETRHRVTLSRGYLIGRDPVTQRQWAAVMGRNPSRYADCGGDCPVEQVSWEDAHAFVERLNALIDCGGFRLPTEAEWEYACRAGSETALYSGTLRINPDDPAFGPELQDIAWFHGNAGGTTHPIRQKRANAWGLHDMLGNVWQWCEDRYGDYGAADAVDPAGSARGANRVVRGGSFSDNARSGRCDARDSDGERVRLPIYGLRIARSLRQ